MSESATTRVVLVRHGQSHDNVVNRLAGWSDSPLTSLGATQAERAADWIARRYPAEALYASPLRRAQQTAEALARRTGLTPRLQDGLRELFFGDLDGLTIPEIEERFPETWAAASNEIDLDYQFPNGELRRAFYARIWDTYTQIVREHAGECVVLVTHGGVISSLLAYLVTGRFTRWREFLVQNCGIVELRSTGERHEVVDQNLVEHLEDLPVW